LLVCVRDVKSMHTSINRQVVCIARAKVRDIYVYSRVPSQKYYNYYLIPNNVVRTAVADEEGVVAGVVVVDRRMIQVGFRKSIHFHLRSLLLGNHLLLDRQRSRHLLDTRCLPRCQLGPKETGGNSLQP
jgi:hypothetical protein